MITSNQIVKCHSCELRNLVAKNYKPKNKYHSFGFYYEPKDIEKSKYVIVMQNPVWPKGWKNSEEYKELSQIKSARFISTSKKYLVQWLSKKNKTFSEKFFGALKEYKLVEYDDLKNYMENKFLSDFLVTDLVKCRTETKDIKPEHIEKCSKQYLFNEIIHCAKNKLIFAFSSRTWEVLYREFIPEQNSDDKKVSNAHGKLFSSKIPNSYFIPLAHFSQRQFNYYLRDSYFDYLKKGLKEYTKGGEK